MPQKTTLADVDKALAGATEYENVNIYKGKRKVKPNEEFVMLFFESFDDVVSEYNLTMGDLKVLMKVMKYVSYGNLISLSQQDIADELGVHRQAVNRSWKKLTDSGIMFMPNGKKTLFLNPNFIVKGELLKAQESEAYKEIALKYEQELRAEGYSEEKIKELLKERLKF